MPLLLIRLVLWARLNALELVGCERRTRQPGARAVYMY